jgi:hypothetical protein
LELGYSAEALQGHRRLGQPDAAVAGCQAGRTYYPDGVELLFTEAVLRHEQGDGTGAEMCLTRLLQLPAGEHFARVDRGSAATRVVTC